eukprot:1160544-Pelagomonas_calceolata.AAC.6
MGHVQGLTHATRLVGPGPAHPAWRGFAALGTSPSSVEAHAVQVAWRQLWWPCGVGPPAVSGRPPLAFAAAAAAVAQQMDKHMEKILDNGRAQEMQMSCLQSSVRCKIRQPYASCRGCKCSSSREADRSGCRARRGYKQVASRAV